MAVCGGARIPKKYTRNNFMKVYVITIHWCEESRVTVATPSKALAEEIKEASYEVPFAYCTLTKEPIYPDHVTVTEVQLVTQ